MAKKRRKPRGQIGPITVGEEGSFEAVDFPDSKDEIEAFILRTALRVGGKESTALFRLVGEPVQNPEDDFDFTLITESGPQPLDLAEIAPLGSGGYKSARGSYHVGERADKIWELLAQKAMKYSRPEGEGPHILLYSTDWRFRVSDGVLDLVAYYCHRRGLCFHSVSYFAQSDETDGQFSTLFPRSPESFRDFNEAARRARQVMIGDPTSAKWGTDEEGNAFVVIKLVPPPYPPK